MADDALIRRAALRKVMQDRGLSLRDLQDRVGSTYSYWRDLLRDDKKPFGEKAARRIEAALDLPRGYLDRNPSPDDDAYIVEHRTIAPAPPRDAEQGRYRWISDSDFALLEDFSLLTDDEQQLVRADLHARAERMKKIRDEVLARFLSKGRSGNTRY
jgi:transcriptional regulator with XRE-family HTH domain